MASTVDVISHGRLLVGLGAGWYEHEWRAYGYGFPDVPERMRAFREACQIIDAMWTQDYPEFQGKHYAIDKPINEPKGVQKPHPPLWIGGGGEKVTLRLAARYGDACNVGGDAETLRHKFEVLRRHCAEAGRNYEDIIRSTSINVLLLRTGEDPDAAIARARGSESDEDFRRIFWVGTSEQIVARLRPLIEAGANYAIVYLPRIAYDQEPVRRFAQEVIPYFS